MQSDGGWPGSRAVRDPGTSFPDHVDSVVSITARGKRFFHPVCLRLGLNRWGVRVRKFQDATPFPHSSVELSRVSKTTRPGAPCRRRIPWAGRLYEPRAGFSRRHKTNLCRPYGARIPMKRSARAQPPQLAQRRRESGTPVTPWAMFVPPSGLGLRQYACQPESHNVVGFSKPVPLCGTE